MGEVVLIALWGAAWLLGLFLAARLVLWLLRSIVRAVSRGWHEGRR